MMERFVFPAPPSETITILSAINLIWAATSGFMEARGIHVQYSKLMSSGHKDRVVIPSKSGMLIGYFPALLCCTASFLLFPPAQQVYRSLLLHSVLTLHFLKRNLEVLFIHKYSGGMALHAVITISLSYLVSATGLIYAQHQTERYPDPSVDLKHVGIHLFFVGITGNGYHHYLLSTLRRINDKAYKIPTGGFFSLVICPHYFFELIEFVGFAFIAQTTYCFTCAVAVASYFLGRSWATRRWYISKFEDFPRHVKAMIPYVL